MCASEREKVCYVLCVRPGNLYMAVVRPLDKMTLEQLTPHLYSNEEFIYNERESKHCTCRVLR